MSHFKQIAFGLVLIFTAVSFSFPVEADIRKFSFMVRSSIDTNKFVYESGQKSWEYRNIRFRVIGGPVLPDSDEATEWLKQNHEVYPKIYAPGKLMFALKKKMSFYP